MTSPSMEKISRCANNGLVLRHESWKESAVSVMNAETARRVIQREMAFESRPLSMCSGSQERDVKWHSFA